MTSSMNDPKTRNFPTRISSKKFETGLCSDIELTVLTKFRQRYEQLLYVLRLLVSEAYAKDMIALYAQYHFPWELLSVLESLARAFFNK